MSTGAAGRGSPLAGVRILDLSRILAGPYATMMLADLGAEVIKIEPPGGDDTRTWGPPFGGGEAAYFLAVNRGKKSVVLNLKTEEGSRALARLIASSDVLVENFRPGTLARLGFAPEEVQGRHPRLIWCSVSAYGQYGPLSSKPGYDAVMQGEAGWMGLTGPPEGPPTKLGASLADICAGMMASSGILAALFARERDGRGRRVDVALFDSVVATLCYQAQGYLLTGEEPVRSGNNHPSLTPYESFEAADGHVIVAVGNDALWKRFCEVAAPELDRPEFEKNPDRVRRRTELRALLEPVFRSRDVAGWEGVLDATGVPVGRVRSVAEILNSPQLRARGMVVDREHPVIGSLRLVGSPIQFDGENHTATLPPPLRGEHTEDVLDAIGGSTETD
ncbi:MAG: CoA transferase [Acidobacteria bacterium]|nr:CoA transferase [Acidobacteriota bacterium]MYA45867.1 CoA transferase [Acidobacteriota bacterium]MYI39750.1 CoA transferase [Acidobacteriota bacterium]